MTEQNTPVETDDLTATSTESTSPESQQSDEQLENGTTPESSATTQASTDPTGDGSENEESPAQVTPDSMPSNLPTESATPIAPGTPATANTAVDDDSGAEVAETATSQQSETPEAVDAPSKGEPQTDESSDAPEVAMEIPFGFIDTKDRIHQLSTEHFRGRVIGKVIGKPEIHIEEYSANFQPLSKEVEVLEGEVGSAKNKVQVMGRVRRMKSTAGKAEALGDFEDLFTRLNALETTIQQEIGERRAAKESIIERAEPLADSTDWRATGDKFKELFQEWKKIGATGREADDKLWARFIAPREKFNTARSAHYDQMREKWDENRVVKQDLIVQAHELSTSDEWRETSIAMRNLMDEWKKAGSAGRQSDDELWKQFREAQQHFYDRRALIYEDNKRRKEQLCERAERLSDSTDWDATVEEMKSMMAEWKTVGMAGKRDLEDKLWNRFRSAQNTFFDKRYEQARVRETQSREALKSREDLVAEIEGLAYSSDSVAAGEKAAELKAKLDELPSVRNDREEALDRRARKAMGDIRVNAAAEGARRSVSWEGKLREALERSQQQIAGLKRTLTQQETDLKAVQDKLSSASGDEATAIQEQIDQLSSEIADNKNEIERLEGSVGGIGSSLDD